MGFEVLKLHQPPGNLAPLWYLIDISNSSPPTSMTTAKRPAVNFLIIRQSCYVYEWEKPYNTNIERRACALCSLEVGSWTIQRYIAVIAHIIQASFDVTVLMARSTWPQSINMVCSELGSHTDTLPSETIIDVQLTKISANGLWQLRTFGCGASFIRYIWNWNWHKF